MSRPLLELLGRLWCRFVLSVRPVLVDEGRELLPLPLGRVALLLLGRVLLPLDEPLDEPGRVALLEPLGREELDELELDEPELEPGRVLDDESLEEPEEPGKPQEPE